MDLSDTRHSVDEQLLDHIGIRDEIVNKYKTQLILTYSPNNELEKIHGRRIIQINPASDQEIIKNVLKRYISSGRIGIYAEVDDRDYNKVQQCIIELFSGDNTIKFIKATRRAQEIDNEAECHKQISLYHTKESLHSGINETYKTLKEKIFFPKLVKHIQLIINNCSKCQAIKYDRNPIKPKFSITETPNNKNEIIHLDVFHYKKQTFVVIIDKLTKFAVAYLINDRNWVKKIAIIEGYIATFGKLKKIIMDNELKSEQIKKYLQDKEIEIHWTKPNSHTGNADVERLNSTIIEKMQAIEEDMSTEQKLYMVMGNYNDRYHSTIEMTPRIANSLTDMTSLINRLNDKKAKYVGKINKGREDYIEGRKEGYIKNYKRVRHKNEPYFRKYPLEKVHITNIKRPYKFTGSRNATNDDDKHSTRATAGTSHPGGEPICEGKD